MTKPTFICGVSVHKATLIVGIIVLVCNVITFAKHVYILINEKYDINFVPVTWKTLSATNKNIIEQIYLIYTIFTPSGGDVSGFYVVVSFVSSVCAVLLIYGNRTQKPVFYCPFLGFMLMDILFSSPFTILFLSFIFIVPSIPLPRAKPKEVGEATMSGETFLTAVFIYTLIYLFRFYFFVIVVNRSRKLIIEEKKVMGGIEFSKRPDF